MSRIHWTLVTLLLVLVQELLVEAGPEGPHTPAASVCTFVLKWNSSL